MYFFVPQFHLPLVFLSCHVDPNMSFFSQSPLMDVFKNGFTTDGQLVYYIRLHKGPHLDGVASPWFRN